MGLNDGEIIGTTKILDHGDASERFNLVLVAEGYRESELATFKSDAEYFVSALSEFGDLICAFNVYRIDVASTDSGADDPQACGGTGATPKTFFDARFCTGGVRRALTVNTSLVLQVVGSEVPQFHSVLVIVNSPIYGGTGGTVGVSSTATVKSDGTPVDWREIGLHEMGHSIFGLADEYEYYRGCDSGESGQDIYPWSSDPPEPNVTNSPTAAGKWADLILPDIPLPTTSNSDCSQCDDQPDPFHGQAVIGTFEGAKYFHCGLYRPTFNCKMRKLGAPFCAVCRRVITEYLLPFNPGFCKELIRVRKDLDRWAVVAMILFGVAQDGDGVVIVGASRFPSIHGVRSGTVSGVSWPTPVRSHPR